MSDSYFKPMTYKKQYNFRGLKRLVIALFFLASFFLSEPFLRSSLTFAVTYFDNPKINSQEIKLDYANEESAPAKSPEKSRAPEPSTLFLILSGSVGIIVRFARRSFERFKRALDLFLSVLGLFITSPIIFIGAVLIKLTSPGPVFYKQNRVGKNGEVFEIYKLRTMQVDAEKSMGAVWAKENDPRITPVGRVLRKSHIDEIPQLLNVLRGQMSIVGPRPERPEMVRDLRVLIRDYEKRLQIKPGITGLAQVWHKYDETIEDVKKKIKFDLLYIKRMCLLVDLRILANTIVVVLTGRGAR